MGNMLLHFHETYPPQLSMVSLTDLKHDTENVWQSFHELYNVTLERNITANSEYFDDTCWWF